MQADADVRLKLKRLSKVEKTELFKTIRFGFLHHEDLLRMTSNPVFELAKNFIVEGLSVRLDTYENSKKKNLNINLEPRVNYELNISAIHKNDHLKDDEDKGLFSNKNLTSAWKSQAN